MWSLRCVATKTCPDQRHDGSAFGSDDSKRKKWARGVLDIVALLCQVTGDWKMYKETFRFPQHNEVSGCCFKCRVTPDGIRNTSLQAPWRQDRLDHWQLVARLLGLGKTLCPLFDAPGFKSRVCKLDWLHVVDLGIAADWLGQLFTFLLRKYPGNTVDERVSALWVRIEELYDTYPPEANWTSSLDPC